MTTKSSQPTTDRSHPMDPISVRKRARTNVCRLLRQLGRQASALEKHIAELEETEAKAQVERNGHAIKDSVAELTQDITAWSAAEGILEWIEESMQILSKQLGAGDG
jgi:hypothetical protein